jgi:hypothetical protein
MLLLIIRTRLRDAIVHKESNSIARLRTKGEKTMPNMSNPDYASTVASNLEGAKNRLSAAQSVVDNINASIAYPQNNDANTMTSYNAELVVYQARVTAIQAEITALNAIT